MSETEFVSSNDELNNNETSPDLSFNQSEVRSYDHNFATSSKGQDSIHEINEMVDIKKNFMASFYGWGSTTSRLEPL